MYRVGWQPSNGSHGLWDITAHAPQRPGIVLMRCSLPLSRVRWAVPRSQQQFVHCLLEGRRVATVDGWAPVPWPLSRQQKVTEGQWGGR